MVCTKLQRHEEADKVGEYQVALLRPPGLLMAADRLELLDEVWSKAGWDGKTERSPSVGSRLTAWEFSGGPNQTQVTAVEASEERSRGNAQFGSAFCWL